MRNLHSNERNEVMVSGGSLEEHLRSLKKRCLSSISSSLPSTTSLHTHTHSALISFTTINMDEYAGKSNADIIAEQVSSVAERAFLLRSLEWRSLASSSHLLGSFTAKQGQLPNERQVPAAQHDPLRRVRRRVPLSFPLPPPHNLTTLSHLPVNESGISSFPGASVHVGRTGQTGGGTKAQIIPPEEGGDDRSQRPGTTSDAFEGEGQFGGAEEKRFEVSRHNEFQFVGVRLIRDGCRLCVKTPVDTTSTRVASSSTTTRARTSWRPEPRSR